MQPSNPSVAELESTLLSITTRTEVRVTILTEPATLKVSPAGVPFPPHFFQLRKRSRLVGLVCACYTGLVNERRVAEGKAPDFVPKARTNTNGGRVGQTPLIHGKDGLLLELIVTDVEDVRYELDGCLIATADVDPWLIRSRDAGSSQGLARPVVYRTVKLANIVDLEVLPSISPVQPAHALQT